MPQSTDSLIELDTELGSITRLECAGMLPEAIPEAELRDMLETKPVMRSRSIRSSGLRFRRSCPLPG